MSIFIVTTILRAKLQKILHIRKSFSLFLLKNKNSSVFLHNLLDSCPTHILLPSVQYRTIIERDTQIRGTTQTKNLRFYLRISFFFTTFAPDFILRYCGFTQKHSNLYSVFCTLYSCFLTGFECRSIGILLHEFAGFFAFERLRRKQCKPQRRRYFDGHVQPCPTPRQQPHDTATQLFLLSARNDVRLRALRP